MNLHILFEDNDIIVCYKPAGVPTQTAKMGSQDMESMLKNHIYKTQKEKKPPYVAVIHRLDQPVEGLLVFAKNPAAAKELSKEVQRGAGFGKYYKAVLCGVPKEASGKLENYLVKDGKTNTSRVCEASEKDAKKAVLNYEVLKTAESNGQAKTLVQVKLDTGRHHQIRVQMANMGCPILGDTKYGIQSGTQSSTQNGTQSRTQNSIQRLEHGDVQSKWQQIALCAYRLEFVHPRTKKKMSFELEPKGAAFVTINE